MSHCFDTAVLWNMRAVAWSGVRRSRTREEDERVDIASGSGGSSSELLIVHGWWPTPKLSGYCK